MEFGEANLSLVTLKAQVKKYEEEGIIQEFDHNSCFNLASSKGLLSCLQYLVELKRCQNIPKRQNLFGLDSPSFCR